MCWKSRLNCPTNSPASLAASQGQASALGAADRAAPGLRLVAAAHMGLAVMSAFGCALSLVELGRILASRLVGVVANFAGRWRLSVLRIFFASHG